MIFETGQSFSIFRFSLFFGDRDSHINLFPRVLRITFTLILVIFQSPADTHLPLINCHFDRFFHSIYKLILKIDLLFELDVSLIIIIFVGFILLVSRRIEHVNLRKLGSFCRQIIILMFPLQFFYVFFHRRILRLQLLRNFICFTITHIFFALRAQD